MKAVKEFDKTDFFVLTEYIRAVKANSQPSNIIRPYTFYTYEYDFDKSGDYNKIRFWDMMPLVFVYDAYKREDGYNFVGINFHHIPVLSRQIWLARLKKVRKESFYRNESIVIKYAGLESMFKKASHYGVRQYRRERVSLLREIPNQAMDLLMKFYSNTYYGATYKDIASNYKKQR